MSRGAVSAFSVPRARSTLVPSDGPARARGLSFRDRPPCGFLRFQGIICILSYPTSPDGRPPSPLVPAHISEGRKGCATFERRIDVIEVIVAIDVCLAGGANFSAHLIYRFVPHVGVSRGETQSAWAAVSAWFARPGFRKCRTSRAGGTKVPPPPNRPAAPRPRLRGFDSSGPMGVLTSPIRPFPGPQMKRRALRRHPPGAITIGHGGHPI